MLDAHAVKHRDKHFERGIAGTRAETCHRAVDAVGAGFDRGQRVGDSQRHVVVAMETELGPRFQLAAQQRDPRRHIVGQHVAGRVGAIQAVRAVALHQQCLLDEFLRPDHVRHHQEADRVESHLATHADMLFRDIRLGAVRRHANRADTAVTRHLQVIHGTDTRQQQRRYLRALHHADHGLEIFLVGVARKTVVDRTPAEPIAMRDLDQWYPRFIESARHRAHLVERYLVLLGVHAIAQTHIVQRYFPAFEVHDHFLICLPGCDCRAERFAFSRLLENLRITPAQAPGAGTIDTIRLLDRPQPSCASTQPPAPAPAARR